MVNEAEQPAESLVGLLKHGRATGVRRIEMTEVTVG
jgi:hypothetical protein